MKKALIAITLLLLVFMSSVFCDDPPALDSVTIGFKVYKYSETQDAYDLQLYFTDYSGSNAHEVVKQASKSQTVISDYTSLRLDAPLLGFAIWTKNVYNFGLRFKFTMMVNGTKTAYGGYSVRIYKPLFFNTNKSISDSLSNLNQFDESKGLSAISVNSRSGVSCLVDFNDRSYTSNNITYQPGSDKGATFHQADTSFFDNGREGWLYPIAFSFSGYRYTELGDYTATITVEVISNT